MSIAHEPFLSCYIEVLKDALTKIRSLSYDGKSEQAADLADAVHVIPELLNRWEQCDEPALRNNYLEVYDKKWCKTDEDFSLIKVFESRFNELKIDRDRINNMDK